MNLTKLLRLRFFWSNQVSFRQRIRWESQTTVICCKSSSIILVSDQEQVRDKAPISLIQEQYAIVLPSTNSCHNPLRLTMCNPFLPSSSNVEITKISSISLCLFAYGTKSTDLNAISWILDTGATNHMICSTSFFYFN